LSIEKKNEEQNKRNQSIFTKPSTGMKGRKRNA